MDTVWEKSCIISPSLISCFDMCNLENEVKILESAGIKMLHVDILDGHFSPSMPLGLETVRQLRKVTNLEFDVHLMSTNNEYFINELLDIGVQQLVFHLETADHVDGTLNRIREAGVRAGVALKPSTPINELEYIIEKCDTVLLMLINPGYASSCREKQVPYAERKILALRNLIQKYKCNTLIELDGRISKNNIKKFGKSTVDIFVAGSTCLKKGYIEDGVRELLEFCNNI